MHSQLTETQLEAMAVVNREGRPTMVEVGRYRVALRAVARRHPDLVTFRQDGGGGEWFEVTPAGHAALASA